MKKINNCITYIYLNAKTSYKALYVYKAASLLNFITQVILILAQYYLWKAIYDNTNSINDYNFIDMITYIVISFAIGKLYPFNVSNKFGRMVKNGDIIHTLLKPVNFEYQLFTDSIGELLYKLFFVTTPIFAVGYFFLGMRLPLLSKNIIIFTLFWCSSYIFIFILELFIGVFSFYTQSLWGISNFKNSIISLLSGKMLPLNFYPVIFKEVITYLPFATIYFVPVNILMNKNVSNIQLLMFILWFSIITLFIFYKILLSIMIKKIMIQGG